MAMPVKAYLYTSWDKDPVEIRRFAVEQGVSTSYEYLASKIRAVFPSLKDAHFCIYWEDEEHDRVCISTDEELGLALSSWSNSVFKLYLKVGPASATLAPPPPTGVRHPGVVCDGCQQAIYGTRYKCLSCLDYDLCSVCESKGVHVQHSMVAMEKPQCAGRPSQRFVGFQPLGCHGVRHGPCAPWWCPRAQEDKTRPQEHVLSPDEKECVAAISNTVTNLLKPYGINVSVDVANMPDTPPTADQSTDTDPATATGSNSDAPQQHTEDPWLPVVAQLKEMGFDDDGGWLTELVKAKGNDVHKVLDALNHGN